MPGLKEYRENKNAFSGVNAGSPATIDLPSDRGMIMSATWEYAEDGTPANEATLIAGAPKSELIIDGQVFSEYRTADVLKLNKFYGFGFKPGLLSHHFAQPWRRGVGESEATALVASAHREPSMRLYIEEGRVNPTLRQHIKSEGLGARGRGIVAAQPARSANRVIKHWIDIIQAKSSGSTPTRYRYEGGGQRIRGFHFEGSNITAIRMEVDEQERWWYKSLDHLNIDLENNGFFPQPDTWHVVFEAMGGTVESAFDPNYGGMSNEIDFEIYTSDTESVRMVVERYDTPATK
ncbi:hypothetical protein [Kordiimonas sp.]|uniref:hypothetical protein n=1 Tax=Kordiimonas sp. TaxID=1970157 RepID=UPI003A91BEF3